MRWLAIACLVACGEDGSTVTPNDASTSGDGQRADAAMPPGPMHVYVGASDNTIRIYDLNPISLAMTPNGMVSTGGGPSFIAFDPQRRWLVTTNESDSAVESFTIAADGKLTRVNEQPSGGGGPTHVWIAAGKFALVANYGGGNVAVLPIAANGTLSAAVDTDAAGTNAHQIITNAANTVAYVPCKGSDHIAVYNFDANTGALSNKRTVASANGAGPRHIALDPSGNYAFVINELDSTITSYTVAANGDLTPIESVTSLPTGFSGTNTGAEIAVHRSGAYVYASNRGDDSIVRYRFSQGTLTDPQRVSIFGMRPRHFSLALDDTAVLVGKQSSGGIHAFRVDAADGVLTPVGEMATMPGPYFVAGIPAN